MTKEEAVQYLEDYRKMYADIAPERFLEALDILLSNPSVPSDLDAYAREAAIETTRQMQGYTSEPMTEYGFDLIRELLEEAIHRGADWTTRLDVKIGETKIHLEDDGNEFPYTREWLDLESTEFKIPDGPFNDGDVVEVLLRKKPAK